MHDGPEIWNFPKNCPHSYFIWWTNFCSNNFICLATVNAQMWHLSIFKVSRKIGFCEKKILKMIVQRDHKWLNCIFVSSQKPYWRISEDREKIFLQGNIKTSNLTLFQIYRKFPILTTNYNFPKKTNIILWCSISGSTIYIEMV